MKGNKKMNKGAWFRLGKQFGIGALLGGLLGFLVGFFNLFEKPLEFSVLDIILYLDWILLAVAILSFLLFVYHFYNGDQNWKMYKEIDGDNEEGENLYRRLNLSYSYSQTFCGFLTVVSMVELMLGYQISLSADSFEFIVPIWPFVGIAVATFGQMMLLKRHNQVRQMDVPLVPTLKELKANVLIQDEAELQANYKMAFDIVMNLSGAILPSVYVLCFAVSLITGRIELLTLLVAGGIHLYIMLRNLKMAKEFYR